MDILRAATIFQQSVIKSAEINPALDLTKALPIHANRLGADVAQSLSQKIDKALQLDFQRFVAARERAREQGARESDVKFKLNNVADEIGKELAGEHINLSKSIKLARVMEKQCNDMGLNNFDNFAKPIGQLKSIATAYKQALVEDLMSSRVSSMEKETIPFGHVEVSKFPY
jgi:hypothetical protein